MKHCAICDSNAEYGKLVHVACVKKLTDEIDGLKRELMDAQAARRAASEKPDMLALQNAIDYFSAYVSRCELFENIPDKIKYVDYKAALGTLKREFDKQFAAEGEPRRA